MSNFLNKLLHEHLEVTPTIIPIILFGSKNILPTGEEFPQNIMP
jgi:hypothetical protein